MVEVARDCYQNILKNSVLEQVKGGGESKIPCRDRDSVGSQVSA